MDWHRGPGSGEDAAAGVAELLTRAQKELGGPLLGAKFLYDARQMLAATREIERAISKSGTTLYVGFRRAEKLDREAPIYRRLTGQGVQVIAFGTGTPAEVAQVRWVRLPDDHGALENQWFLVTESPEPIGFVGFETSPSDRIGEGGATDPSRTWAGFVTDDARLVGAIVGYLQGLADREAPPAPDGHGTAQSTMLLVATDDGADPAYAVCRRAGLDLARREGAAVILYDRSAESYLVDPYEYGPWTSQNHGPAGDRPLDLPDLLRLGRRYLAEQVDGVVLRDQPAPRSEIASWAAHWPPSRHDCRPRSPSWTTKVPSSTLDRPHLSAGRWRSGAVGGWSTDGHQRALHEQEQRPERGWRR